MPKRKVTFQGVGNEDEEDDISVPKKKVRGPDSCVVGRSEGERKETRSPKREKAWDTKRAERKGLASPSSLRNGFGRLSV